MLAPVLHMSTVLQKLSKQMVEKTFLQNNSQPQFVLTDGRVNKDKSYIPFDPKLLTPEHLDPRGMLLPARMVFVGCNVPTCRQHVATAPKYPVRLQPAARAFGKDNRPRIASLVTLVNAHMRKSHGCTASTSSGVASMAQAFTFSAGVAQLTPSQPEGTRKSKKKEASSAAAGASSEPYDPNPVVLRIPPDTPPKGSHEEYRQVCLPYPNPNAAHAAHAPTPPTPPTRPHAHVPTYQHTHAPTHPRTNANPNTNPNPNPSSNPNPINPTYRQLCV
jgi:hypothetical protein